MFVEQVNKLKPWRHWDRGRQCDALYLAPTLKNATKLYNDEHTRTHNPYEVVSNSVLKGVIRSVTGVVFGN